MIQNQLRERIVFNKPFCCPKGINYIVDSIEEGKISGDGKYTKLCNEWFFNKINRKVLLTTSCSSALDMMPILTNLQAGDEVIMPSYTFVSTANSFVQKSCVPVFADIKADSLNIDEDVVESLITPKTRAIVAVHYAGMSCDMDKMRKIAKEHNLFLLEDAAQALGSKYKNEDLGTIGDLGTYSFHETKNIIAGEGGCLIINNEEMYERAEIIREKGTNRSKFFRGQVDKYTWVDVGSSFLPSDIISAFLYSQLENFDEIQQKRMYIWNKYHEFFREYELKGLLKRPVVPQYCTHNAHMYYVLFNSLEERTEFIDYLKKHDIVSVFHYIPLHSSPAGIKYGKTPLKMDVTDIVSDTLLRLPLYYTLSDDDMNRIFSVISDFFARRG